MPASSPSTQVTCGFCAMDHRSARPLWDTPLLRSPHFRVIPSLGSLVEGWLLVVPNTHVVASSRLAASLFSELEVVVDAARSLVARAYGPAWVFEHGPASEGGKVGCTVDHAHVHVVPTRVDLVAGAAPYLGELRPQLVEGMKEAFLRAGEGDYLFAESPAGKSSLIVGEGIGSQVFRRAVADAIGLPGQYDWRAFPQHANVVATIAKLGGFAAEIGRVAKGPGVAA